MAYGCLMECIPLGTEAVNTHREKPKVRQMKRETERKRNDCKLNFQNCRPDRTLAEALNEFLEEPVDTVKVRTKTEIVYKSGGTNIQTIDVHGNEVKDYAGANSDSSFI